MLSKIQVVREQTLMREHMTADHWQAVESFVLGVSCGDNVLKNMVAIAKTAKSLLRGLRTAEHSAIVGASGLASKAFDKILGKLEAALSKALC